MKWRENPASVRPMLATLAEPPLSGAGLVFEPKYDGIRALVHVPPAGKADDVRIWSRLGNEKTTQFPSVVRSSRFAGGCGLLCSSMRKASHAMTAGSQPASSDCRDALT